MEVNMRNILIILTISSILTIQTPLDLEALQETAN